jgi:hypothetical protein
MNLRALFTLLCCCFLFVGCGTTKTAHPKFESYLVAHQTIKNLAPAQIPKSGIDWKMEEYLHYSNDEPPNFADKFTLFDIGCGTGCIEFCLIDKTTGTVYPGDDFNQDFPQDYNGPYGFQFHRNSRLLVVYSAEGFDYPIHVDYYILDGTKLKLLKSDSLQKL